MGKCIKPALVALMAAAVSLFLWTGVCFANGPDDPDALPQAGAAFGAAVLPQAAEIQSAAPVQETYESKIPLDNDELFSEYVEFQFMLADAPAPSGRQGAKLSGTNRALYDCLRVKVADVAAGMRASTAFVFSLEDLGQTKSWTASELGVSAIVRDDAIAPEAKAALMDRLDLNLSAVVRALLADCPYELYWFDKSVGASMTGFGMTAFYEKGEYHLAFYNGCTVSLTVAQGYAAGQYQVDTANAERVQHAVTKAAAIVTAAAGKSDYEKLVYYRQQICGLVVYDSAAAEDESTPYGDPWQLVSVFDEDTGTNVVCEGYSKAFRYLCDSSDFTEGIDCHTVTGTMKVGNVSGPHMWNIVTMGDGENYLVDVTNCDTGSVGAPDQLFLAGYKSGSVAAGYTFGCSSADVQYDYDANTKSDYAAELVISPIAYETGGHAYTDDGLTYWVTATKARVTGFSGSATQVVIPAAVQGVPVTAIGKGAFAGTAVQTVKIPDSVLSIQEKAFDNCSELTWIVVGNPSCTLCNAAGTLPSAAVVYGASGSSAEAYAGRYGRTFVSLEAVPDPALIRFVAGTAAACVDAGTEPYYTDGTSLFADAFGVTVLSQSDIVIPALGHDYADHEGQPATCTEAGWEPYRTCNRCDYSSYVEIPALGHNLTHHAAQAATCTEVGWDAYDDCDRCDYTTYMEEPALGHGYADHEGQPATCTEAGWEPYQTCNRCDYTSYVEIPAHHTWDDGTVTKDPTYVGEGEMTYACTCEGCEATKTEPIAALPKTALSECTVTLSKTAFVYDGKAKVPAVTVKLNGVKLAKDVDYTVAFYNASGTKVASPKAVGAYKVKVAAKPGNVPVSGSVTKAAAFKVNPPATAIRSLAKGTKSFKVTWTKKTAQVTGYQIRYSTSSQFTKATTKTVAVPSQKTVTRTVKSLKAKKKYYVQVRTYKTVGKTKFYSSWSAKKYVTTK